MSKENNKMRGLGKGLSALFSEFDEEYDAALQPERVVLPKDERAATASTDTPIDNAPAQTAVKPKPASPDVSYVDIELIEPNVNQPRKSFDDDKLKELAASIKLHGVIQPVILTPAGGKYMIIAGERRYRASILAGLSSVPAIVREYTPLQVKEISLIENLQREDLNPIEAANAIRQLMTEYRFTQDDVANRIAKSRSAVANILRLLTLCPEVIKLVAADRLSAGHARALVVVEDADLQLRLALAAADHKMSVRELEKLVKKHLRPEPPRARQEQSIELKELVSDMQRVFATKVSAIGSERRGRIYIDYFTPDDLDRINELIATLKKDTAETL